MRVVSKWQGNVLQDAFPALLSAIALDVLRGIVCKQEHVFQTAQPQTATLHLRTAQLVKT